MEADILINYVVSQILFIRSLKVCLYAAKDGKKGESSGKDNSLKNSKKAESSVKENSQKNGRLNQEILASSSTDYKMPLVWIDLEMTGTNLHS